MIRALARACFVRVDGASLVFLRIAFGAVLFLWVAHLYLEDEVGERFIGVEVHFPFVSWLPPASNLVMFAVVDGIAVLGLFIALGFFSRVCCALAAALFLYVFLLDKCWYQNHEYLMVMLAVLLAVMPVHDALSTSSLLTHRAPSSWTVPAWCLWAMRAQIAVVYVYAGLAKLNHDWLVDAQPMKLWLAERTDLPVLGPLLAPAATAYVMSWAGMLFDLGIVPALSWRRTRAPAVVALVAFHALNGILWPIDVFPVLGVAATLVLLPPDWPRRLLRAPAAQAALASPAPTRVQAIVAALVGVYVVVQVLLPLRPFVHGGDSSWTEIDHRFSWRMMLRRKEGDLTLYAVEPKTGLTFEVGADEHLRDFQLDEVVWRPDILRDLCAWLGPRLEAERRQGREELHAVDELSMNGHAPALLVDPAVDLAHAAGDEDTFVLARDDAAAQERARTAARALAAAAAP